jgi:hypothetical protein
MTDQAHGARWVEYVRLNEVEPARANPKDHDVDGIVASLEHHGIGELMLIDERTGRLVAGHGRLEALDRAFAADPAAPPDGVDVDTDGYWLIPVIRGWRSDNDDQAAAYLAESNFLVELGGWKPRETASYLADLEARKALDHLPKATRGSLDDLRKQLAARSRPKAPQAARQRRNLPSIAEAVLDRLQAAAHQRGVSVSWLAEDLITRGLDLDDGAPATR